MDCDYHQYYHSFSDQWMMFDDDRVSSVTGEDILKLSGGGTVWGGGI